MCVHGNFLEFTDALAFFKFKLLTVFGGFVVGRLVASPKSVI